MTSRSRQMTRVIQEFDLGPRGVPAIEAPSAPIPCDVTTLDDDALRDLGGHVLDELERRNVDG